MVMFLPRTTGHVPYSALLRSVNFTDVSPHDSSNPQSCDGIDGSPALVRMGTDIHPE